MSSIRIAGIVRQSIVDGSGLRFVVFTQGCPHGCPGCHNPDTHDPSGGYLCEIDKILEAFDENPLLAGITFSGGEPFVRAGELLPLAAEIRRRGKNIWCYSGYTFEQLLTLAEADPNVRKLLSYTHILVDGRFIESERDLTLHFRGSRNQRIIDVPRSLAAGFAVISE